MLPDIAGSLWYVGVFLEIFLEYFDIGLFVDMLDGLFLDLTYAFAA